MARYAVAVSVVVALAIGVWLLLPGDAGPPATTTSSTENPTTTTTTPTTTTTESTTTTEEITSHVVETVEEAEAILRELWFGWFEGIYNQDEDRIREVVATDEQVEIAKEQFGVMEFTSAPTLEGLSFSQTEVLRSDAMCLAVWSLGQADFRGGSTQRVDVVRRSDDHWVLLSHWPNRGDLWQSDCEAVLP